MKESTECERKAVKGMFENLCVGRNTGENQMGKNMPEADDEQCKCQSEKVFCTDFC